MLAVVRDESLRHYRADPMEPDRLSLLHEVVDAVSAVMAAVTDLGPSGRRTGQYAFDLVADEAALGVLRRAGVAVLSEETGLLPGATDEIVVLDPVDGSTNASRSIPWFATSVCLVDRDGPAAAVVANLATGVRWSAVRGGGAWCDGTGIAPSGCIDLSSAIVGLNGLPPGRIGCAQTRSLGALALDLCAVASGMLDGYVDWVDDNHGPWDYMAGWLVCREAGAVVAEGLGRDLLVLEHAARRAPVAAATPALLADLLALRSAPTQR